ncbi:MAG: ubiquinone/menaquinone biosynthesis methyltransferase [Desulfohalobiaceae bacterium]|nr:ubiquinone/menaquinone biosynthesis methyltransferase [Desulfohalobiaceae bacterium]
MARPTEAASQPQPTDPNKQVAEMFGRITPCYDLLNRVLSLGSDIYWRRRLVRSVSLRPRGRLLDLAAGTLDVSRAVSRTYPSSGVVSVDLSRAMLLKGKTKVDLDRVQPACGNAVSIPLLDASVDCVTIAFGIRNISPRSEAYAEIHRVLAPGGKLCILEFGAVRPGLWGRIYTRYLHSILPRIGALVTGDSGAYSYLAATIASFPRADALGRELTEAGFVQVGYTPMSAGIVWLHTARKQG